jgi:hypothetical protein
MRITLVQECNWTTSHLYIEVEQSWQTPHVLVQVILLSYMFVLYVHFPIRSPRGRAFKLSTKTLCSFPLYPTKKRKSYPRFES